MSVANHAAGFRPLLDAPTSPGSNVATQLRARPAKAARERDLEKSGPATPAAPGSANSAASRQLALPRAKGRFAAHGFVPFAFQREVWDHAAAGRSGPLHATTGAGKTYAVYFGLLDRALQGEVPAGGLRLLRITPMRALAADAARALEAPLADLGHRIARAGDGRWVVPDPQVAKRHRMASARSFPMRRGCAIATVPSWGGSSRGSSPGCATATVFCPAATCWDCRACRT